MKNRKNFDEHEKDPAYLKNSEDAYIELSELYNWDKIECVKDDKIKSIDEISQEIIKIIKEMDN